MDPKFADKAKKKLSQEAYNVCFLKGTEPPGSGKYLHNKARGIYVCAVCGQKLFSSDTKYESNTGWPSFWDFAEPGTIKEQEDFSMGIPRTEVLCANCGLKKIFRGYFGLFGRNFQRRLFFNFHLPSI